MNSDYVHFQLLKHQQLHTYPEGHLKFSAFEILLTAWWGRESAAGGDVVAIVIPHLTGIQLEEAKKLMSHTQPCAHKNIIEIL